MPSRLKSHITLVLDRLQCVARVNCLVLIKHTMFSLNPLVLVLIHGLPEAVS